MMSENLTREEKYILAFQQVCKDNDPAVFSDEAITDLAELDRVLGNLAEPSPQKVAEIIRNWCIKYPNITDAIIAELGGSRGWKLPETPDPKWGRGKPLNKYPRINELLQEIANKSLKKNSESGNKKKSH